MQFQRFFSLLLPILLISPWAGADVLSEVRLLSESFVSPSYNAAAKSNYQFLGASFSNSAFTRKQDSFLVDIKAGYAFGAPMMSYLNLKEFAYRFEIGDRQSFSFGRKQQRWSELDERWNFGLIEPVFKVNPLAPESQGLTGMFWEVKDSGYRLGLFGSFFYLPDQGPGFEIDNSKQVVRGNPWVRRPPSYIKVFSEASQIDYVLDRPSESQVILQSSYGVKLEVGEESPFRLRTSMFYKPMNQLAIGYDGVLDTSTLHGEVQLQPEVMYHSIAAVDALYVGQTVRAGLSVAQDRPSRDNPFEKQWTAPVFSDATLVSPFLDVRLMKGVLLTVQSLNVSGGEVTETGDLAKADRPAITMRYPYQQAAQVALKVEQRWFRKFVQLGTSYTQSSRNKFSLVKGQARVEMTPEWNVQSEIQLVRADDPSVSNRNEIADFRNNDRVMLGMGYVF